jgi:hypothetical protein
MNASRSVMPNARLNDEVLDGDSGFVRDAKVRLRIPDRVDDHGGRAAHAAEQVRRGDGGIGVQKVAKNHVNRRW